MSWAQPLYPSTWNFWHPGQWGAGAKSVLGPVGGKQRSSLGSPAALGLPSLWPGTWDSALWHLSAWSQIVSSSLWVRSGSGRSSPLAVLGLSVGFLARSVCFCLSFCRGEKEGHRDEHPKAGQGLRGAAREQGRSCTGRDWVPKGVVLSCHV